MIPNEFIEIELPRNHEKSIVSISSIALIEKVPNGWTRILLKEKDTQGNNFFVDTITKYDAIKDEIDKYQKKLQKDN